MPRPRGLAAILITVTSSADALVVLNKVEASASLIDLATGEERARLPTGAGPHEAATAPVGILLHPNGKRAFVANTNADVVTVLDLEPLAVSGRLRAGKEPAGMAYTPVAPGGL